MATLAALGTMLLGMGQRDPATPLAVLIAAIASVWLTDFTGWFRLNRTVANLAAVGAVLLALRDLSGLAGMAQILFIARLLFYLQIILLFQKKDSRAYWQLAMVSLLQVVVASAFNQGVWFGVMLIVYLLASLSALTLFFLHRERLRYQPSPTATRPEPLPPARWPLAAQPSAFSGSTTPVRGSLGRELLGRLAAMAVATLLLTVLLFFTVPRVGSDVWRGAAIAQRHAVGFSDEVQLGELGQIIQKPDEVMRLRLTDLDGDLYPVQGGVYLRGAVLNFYREGRWRSARGRVPRRVAPLEITNLLTHAGLIRQQITIEPMDRQEVFCIWPFAKTEPGGELLLDPSRQRLLRPAERCIQRFSYDLKTPAFENGVQVPLTPAAELIDATPLLAMPTRDGQSAVPGLVALAQQWIAESGLPPQDRAGRAGILQNRLRDGGRFEYSLEGQPRDPAVDPIEDFVTQNPKGHCEYFATALALMLRSQKIPARVVVGYYCDEFNDVGRFFQVRQWHAHTWVEAYLDPHQIPDRLFRGEQHWEWAAGGWLRLDATPAGQAGQAEAGTPWLDRVGRSLGWFQSLWNNYVMEMDRSRQREAIYQPLAESIKETAKRLADPQWWRDSLGGLLQAAWQFFLDWIGANWLSWRGLSALLLLSLLLLGAARVAVLLVRRLFRKVSAAAGATSRAARPRVEFYRRLETVLGRRGLVRSASQTQREFAMAAGEALARATGRDQVAGLPLCVAEAFYLVRFGAAALDKQQALAVEQALAELEQAAGSGQRAASRASFGAQGANS